MRTIRKGICGGLAAVLLFGGLTACGERGQEPEETENQVIFVEAPSGAEDENSGLRNDGEEDFASEEGTSGLLEGQIAGQSFETELDGWGRVTFGAFAPPEYEFAEDGQTVFGDVKFLLFSGEQTLYTFPGETEDNLLPDLTRFSQVLSAAFRDYNEDGRADILLLLEYTGSDGSPFNRVRAYTQEEGEKEFRVDRALSDYLGNDKENMNQIYDGIRAYGRSYSVCTDISAWEVERFAKKVRKQILEGDYEGLAEECRYPVTVDGEPCEDKEALLTLLQNPSQAFLDAVREETGEQMFCNWQGIMLGNGEVWIGEALNDDLSSEGLKVIGINTL